MKIKPNTYRHEDGTDKTLVVIDHRTGLPMAAEGVEVPDNDLTFQLMLRDRDAVLVESEALPAPRGSAKSNATSSSEA